MSEVCEGWAVFSSTGVQAGSIETPRNTGVAVRPGAPRSSQKLNIVTNCVRRPCPVPKRQLPSYPPESRDAEREKSYRTSPQKGH